MAVAASKNSIAALEQLLTASSSRRARPRNTLLLIASVVAGMLLAGIAWNLCRPISATDAVVIRSLVEYAAHHREENEGQIWAQLRASLALAPGETITNWQYHDAVRLLIADAVL